PAYGKDPRACLLGRRRPGCRGFGDSPATTMPNFDKCPGRTDRRVRGGRAACQPRQRTLSITTCPTPLSPPPSTSQISATSVPSSFSHAKPGNCCPALITWCVFSSLRSASAFPLISLATSESDGCCGSV